jgi:hypothetical protein
VALLRGTTADLDGNVSFEREALFTDQLSQAMAAHNSGGVVIVQVCAALLEGSGCWGGLRGRELRSWQLSAGILPCTCFCVLLRPDTACTGMPPGLPPPHPPPQVERVVERGTLHPKAVHLPAALVDRVVVAPPELHWQTFQDAQYDGSLRQALLSV